MTQDEKWKRNYNVVIDFINENHRNPSKYEPTEKNMVNWCKQQRKLMNAGSLKPERIEPFKRLLALIEDNKRINQYK